LPGGRLASVSRDRGLRIWNWRDGKCLAALENSHEAAILSVVALADSSLVTASADGEIRHWSGAGRQLGLVGKRPSWAWALAATPDGQVACAYEDGRVTLWRTGRAEPTQTLAGTTPLRTLAINATGSMLATGDTTGTIRVWSSHGGAWRVERAIPAHTGAIRRLRLLADESLVSVGEDGFVRGWNLNDGRGQTLGRYANFATDLLQSGETLFSCGYDGRIQQFAIRPTATAI
jgi:WD40 repeat protein